jgi:hypothetical protein
MLPVFVGAGAALGIVDYLRAQPCSPRLAVLFNELVEQHGVHRLVAHGVDLMAVGEALNVAVELAEAGLRGTPAHHSPLGQSRKRKHSRHRWV